MKCHNVQLLQDAYLDSELDAKTSLEIQRHLQTCSECARLFAEEEKLQLWLKTSLQRGQSSSEFWQSTERAVLAAAQSRAGLPPIARHANSARLTDWLPLWRQLRSGWARSPWTWTGVAAAWLAIWVLNTTAHDTGPALLARQEAPSASEVRFALKQKQVLMAELALPTESSSTANSKPAAPGPRSDRHRNSLNS